MSRRGAYASYEDMDPRLQAIWHAHSTISERRGKPVCDRHFWQKVETAVRQALTYGNPEDKTWAHGVMKKYPDKFPSENGQNAADHVDLIK